MNKALFNQFDPVSAKAWKQKIQLDLKGADYNETLIWHSLEGIDVKPFYHSEDLNDDQLLDIPVRSSWNICQDVCVKDADLANSEALTAIQKGAESVRFFVSDEDVDISILFKDIVTPIHLKLEFLSTDFINKLDDYAKETGKTIFTEIDIIGNLARTGNWFSNLKEDHENLDTIITNSKNLESVLCIDVSLYQNAGANIVQQLAYALSHLNEYLNHFNSKLTSTITFKTAVGSNYFFEIAKLRALRVLWNTLSPEYLNNASNCHIITTPSKRNKTLYDYNTNLLRTTTECMSAILGGANTIDNISYDTIYHNKNEFGERIARNQLLILKHESYFDQVTNPTKGAYYIEELTTVIANKALQLFKDIEANGGFLKQLKEGTIQRKIKESAAKEQELFDNGNIVLLGTNKYQNQQDKMKHTIELHPFVENKPRKTLIEPIIERRLAEKIEKSRLESEN